MRQVMTRGTLCFKRALGGLPATIPLRTDSWVRNRRANSHRDLPTPLHMRRNGPTWTVRRSKPRREHPPPRGVFVPTCIFSLSFSSSSLSLSRVSFLSCGTTRSHWGPGWMVVLVFFLVMKTGDGRMRGWWGESELQGEQDGKMSGGQVKGKVWAAGQDRNKDRNKGLVEGRGEGFSL